MYTLFGMTAVLSSKMFTQRRRNRSPAALVPPPYPVSRLWASLPTLAAALAGTLHIDLDHVALRPLDEIAGGEFPGVRRLVVAFQSEQTAFITLGLGRCVAGVFEEQCDPPHQQIAPRADQPLL